VLPDPGFLIRNPGFSIRNLGLCCAKTLFRSAKTLFRCAKTRVCTPQAPPPSVTGSTAGTAARNRAGHHDEVWRGVVAAASGAIAAVAGAAVAADRAAAVAAVAVGGGKGTCGGCSLRMVNAPALDEAMHHIVIILFLYYRNGG
jgi:hypothetical protein